uniref:Reverse transcriptase domain-containing protein n=1 Tax=Coleochaete scutata TaxID=3125 RepID=A0A5P9NW21_COLSC|nr:hypothetical protein [Coleochaete scutata]QFU80152.1 hypothetical protein [Coleochaete scutata]
MEKRKGQTEAPIPIHGIKKVRAKGIRGTLRNDPNYRRLWYVRYADDFLLGFVGIKIEAIQIEKDITNFLEQKLELKVSKEKSGIKHAQHQGVQYLSFTIRCADPEKYSLRASRRLIREPESPAKLHFENIRISR